MQRLFVVERDPVFGVKSIQVLQESALPTTTPNLKINCPRSCLNGHSLPVVWAALQGCLMHWSLSVLAWKEDFPVSQNLQMSQDFLISFLVGSMVQFNQPCNFTKCDTSNTRAMFLSALNSEMNIKKSQNIPNLQDIWNPNAVRWCMRYLHWGLPRRTSGAPLAPPALPTPPVPRVWGARTARSAPHPVAAVPVSAGLDFPLLIVTTDHNSGNRIARECNRWIDMGTDMAKVFHTSFISTSDSWNIQWGCMNPWKQAGRNQLFF